MSTVIRTVLAGALSALLLLPASTALADTNGIGIGGGVIGIGVDNPGVSPGEKIETVCRDGQMFYSIGGVAYSAGGYPGCPQNSAPGKWVGVNQYPTLYLRECTMGYLEFRFYGHVSNPTQSYTVSRVNLPAASPRPTGCPKSGDSRDKVVVDLSIGKFFMMFSTPQDVNPQPGDRGPFPWMRYNSQASDKLGFQMRNTGADDAMHTDVWNTQGQFGELGLPTNGKLIDAVGAGCTVASHPAVHQLPGFNPNSLFGTVSTVSNGQALITYTGQPYTQAVNTWVAGYVANPYKGGRSAVGDTLYGQFLGVNKSTTSLTAADLPGTYTQCGSPMNYQIRLDNVVKRDAAGRPSVVTIPPTSQAPVNGVAYLPITRLAHVFNIDGQEQFGFLVHGTAGDRVENLSTNLGQVANQCTAKNDNLVQCSSKELSLLYPGANAKARSAYRNVIESWLKSNSGTNGVPSYMGSGQIFGMPVNPAKLADWAKVYVNSQSYSLTAPPLCANNTCPAIAAPPTPTPTPTAPSSTPETAPVVPVPSQPENPPTAGKFIWKVTAEGQKYLDVRSSSNANAAPLSFYAELLSEWKGDVAAETYYDSLEQSRLDSAYNSTLAERRSRLSQVSSTKGVGLAAAEMTGASRADLSGEDWAMIATYDGMTLDTYLPQCNTGQTTGCAPQRTVGSSTPVLNASCTTVGCYKQDDVQSVAVLPSSGSWDSSGYSIGKKTLMGVWNYHFFAATAKDKVVRIDRQASTPLDINVSYMPRGGAGQSWSVGYRYKVWVPVWDTRTVSKTCTKWVPFSPPRFHGPGPNEGLEQTYPVDYDCSYPERYIRDWTISGWIDDSASGSAQEQKLPDNLSEVFAPNGQPLSGEQGGAGCQVPAPSGWNYCSPVLSGKVNAGR